MTAFLTYLSILIALMTIAAIALGIAAREGDRDD